MNVEYGNKLNKGIRVGENIDGSQMEEEEEPTGAEEPTDKK